jgi:formylglycine-generating enzyme required for sulfatase activity
MKLKGNQRLVTAVGQAVRISLFFPIEPLVKQVLALVALVVGVAGAQGQTISEGNAPAFFRLTASTTTVITALSPQGMITWSNATAGTTTGRVQKATTLLGPSNWVDYVAFNVTGAVTQLRVLDPNPPFNMAYIPAGSFSMGDNLDGDLAAQPIHTVNVSAFYMDRFEVTKAQWDVVCTWATNHGYSFNNAGAGKTINHSVQTVYWYDVVKWCNARSQKEGRTPAYYTDAGLTAVYKIGQAAPYVNWNTGYRLPTETEWEYAARGGLSGKRFPWGDTIAHNQANYYSAANYSYDVSSTRGYHPSYQVGNYPYTSPMGSLAANGYGLYDMTGNVWEWCWDWWGSYGSGTQTDPHGPVTGSDRLLRGGGWSSDAWYCRTANRISFSPGYGNNFIGFRAVLTSGQ